MRILIAERATIIRSRLVTRIGDMPGVTEVLESSDYAETLELIRRERPHLALLDLGLPGWSGLDLLKAIANETNRPRVIVLSGFTDPNLRHRCIEAGADYFFLKGLEFLEAVATVDRIAAAWQPDNEDDEPPYD